MSSLQAALAGCLVTLVVVGAFMTLDKAYLHWYAEDTHSGTTALDDRVAALEEGLSANSSADDDAATGLSKMSTDLLALRDILVAKFDCVLPGSAVGGPSIVCP